MYKSKKDEIDIRDDLIDYERLEILICLKNRDTNGELVRKHFQVHDLALLLKNLKKSKDNAKRNSIQVNHIKSG